MSEPADQRKVAATTQLTLPPGLTRRDEACPTVFVDTGGVNLQGAELGYTGKVNDAIFQALSLAWPEGVAGQGVLKVHIGEPKCLTRMRPAFATGAKRFAHDSGTSSMVAGDTTVAYTGNRGHKENPLGDAGRYLELAANHGWSPTGPAGVPFVVLDRPSTAVENALSLDAEERRLEVTGIQRFKDFYLAGGFHAADFVVNYSHLTLHGLAGLAGCVKSIAMGCSSLPGKLRMHQSLVPHFDSDRCVACGRCVESCPEDALRLPEGAPCPVVAQNRCIGCGECEAVCAAVKGAVTLYQEDITDWQRGEKTLPFRMADYALGLMQGKWDTTVHVLHMYSITRRCDCLDIRQEPMIERDLGFLVGKNPFAIDALAGRMLSNALRDEGKDVPETELATAAMTASYVSDTYGILPETPVETVVVE